MCVLEGFQGEPSNWGPQWYREVPSCKNCFENCCKNSALVFTPVIAGTFVIFGSHTEFFFSKSYWIKLKSDCIYHAPIDLEQQTDSVRLLFRINRCMVNTIWFRVDLIRFWKDFSVRRCQYTPIRHIYIYIYDMCIYDIYIPIYPNTLSTGQPFFQFLERSS